MGDAVGGATAARNPDRPTNVISGPVRQDGGVARETKPVTRMTSPEKWEIKQVCGEGWGNEGKGGGSEGSVWGGGSGVKGGVVKYIVTYVGYMNFVFN